MIVACERGFVAPEQEKGRADIRTEANEGNEVERCDSATWSCAPEDVPDEAIFEQIQKLHGGNLFGRRGKRQADVADVGGLEVGERRGGPNGFRRYGRVGRTEFGVPVLCGALADLGERVMR